MDNLFDNLVAVVQYSRKGESGWNTMAAFDVEHLAERYAENCAKDSSPWKYRVVPVTEQNS